MFRPENIRIREEIIVFMTEGQVFRCQNPDCRSEIRVEKESIDGISNPICCCGAEMKTAYEPPAQRKLDRTPELIARHKLKQEG